MSGRVRVFIASSLDGFIAGEGNDLSWLPDAPSDGSDHGYGAFMASVGALLMGRVTHDVVVGFGIQWPCMASARCWSRRGAPEARRRHGAAGRGPHRRAQPRWPADAAAGADVYLDGGDIIRRALDAAQPMTCRDAHPDHPRGAQFLFAGCARRHRPQTVSAVPPADSVVQLTLRPCRR
ncbi:MAG: hypothetical protein R3F60_17060 [bacterium]